MSMKHWKNVLEEDPKQGFIAREEKSIPGFQASKDRLTLFLGAKEADDFKLDLVLTYSFFFLNPRAGKNSVKSTLSLLHKWNNKAWMTAHVFTTWFTENFKPNVETYCSREKILFKILLLIDNLHLVTRALMELYKETYRFHACKYNIYSVAHRLRSHFDFQVSLLRNTLHKPLTTRQ